MGQVVAIAAESRGSNNLAAACRGYAFGLTLESEAPVPGVQLPPPLGPGRVTAWREVPVSEIDAAAGLGESITLLERCASDGRLFLRIEACGLEGYRFWAPYYGRHLVSVDGHAIASATPRIPPVRWQRQFFREVLPLAAALQGLMLFSASAVAIDGRVVIVGGPPAIGKTALITHLLALGGTFVSDDVVALDSRESTVVAYPGPARLGVRDAELRRIPSTQEERLGHCIGRSDTLIFEPRPADCVLPVASVYLLRPELPTERIAIRPAETPAGGSLLGANVVDYLVSGEYGERALKFCETLDGVPAYGVTMPRGTRSRDVAAHVLAHFSTTGYGAQVKFA
jgi:hypothetical protein